MFKKFKDKLAEEMKQSPARLTASMQQLAQAVVSPGLSNASIPELTASNDNFSLTEEADSTPKNSPDKYRFRTVDLASPSSNSMDLSRASSVNSITSADTSGFFPIYESSGNVYHLQSDIDQSASEADECSPQNIDQVSKEQIYSAYRKIQSKYHKYRGRYTDLANHYRELERVKFKLESVLVETQDKALRRIADLKEQCQLEQQAKAHLEDALRNDIEEKDHIIDTLNTKVRLLQANGSSSLISFEEHEEPETKNSVSESTDNSAMTAENQQLKNKLKILETLVAKYKESLKNNKEKISELSEEKSILERDFDKVKDTGDALEKQLSECKNEISQLQEQINLMKKREEECVISLAENKLSIHRELEIKEEQIKQLTLELKNAVESRESQSDERDGDGSAAEEIKMLEEKLLNARDDAINYEQVIEQLKVELSEAKDSEKRLEAKQGEKIVEHEKMIENLNSKIQVYVATLQKAKEKIEAQSTTINSLTAEKQNDEHCEKLNSELESKNVEILGLESELKSCRGTINDLRQRINTDSVALDKLEKEKKILHANIMKYLTASRILKDDCEGIKDEMNKLAVKYKHDLSEACGTIEKIVEEKMILKRQYDEANEEIKKQQELLLSAQDKIEMLQMEVNTNEEKYSVLNEELEKKSCNVDEKMSSLISENSELKEEIQRKLATFNEEISLLTSENSALKKEIDKKSLNYEEKMLSLSSENSTLKQAIQAFDGKISHLASENSVIKEDSEKKSAGFNEKISSLTSENSALKDEIQAFNEKISLLTSENSILKDKSEKKSSSYEEKISSLMLENSALKKEIQSFDKKISLLTSENSTLKDESVKKSSSFEEKISSLVLENSALKEKIAKSVTSNEEIKGLTSENKRITVNLQEREHKLNEVIKNLQILSEENTDLKLKISRIQSAMDDKNVQFNAQIQNFMDIIQSKNDFINQLRNKTPQISALMAQNADLAKAIEKEQNHRSKLESNGNEFQLLIDELQSQLQDKNTNFVASEAKQTQIANENEELKIETEQLRHKLSTSESEQALRMKEMVKEFQAQLQDKDKELQAALDQKFDRQKNYESDLIQQYKEQLKDFQIELTAKSEEIESLKNELKSISHNQDHKQANEIIENLHIQHINELASVEKKWKDTLQQQVDELEAKHEAKIADLTRDWKKNQTTDENSKVEKKEELESMSRVAMAAVQSNTGSFHSLQQTLASQRRELIELRKLVKLRHETLEDSTEIEYLRNILYEYMMGKETLVLARVIAAVVKFDQEQTHKILKKEEDKLTLLGSLRVL